MQKIERLIGISSLLVLSINAAVAAEGVKIPPVPQAEPPGQLGETVRLGRELMQHTDTNPLTKAFVGNKLNCSSCHIDAGTTSTVGTFIGSATAFPAWSKREGVVESLQDRIANCFMRSMNGMRPPIDSRAITAMTTYMTWLSEGQPIKQNPIKPVTPFFANQWPDQQLPPLFKQATHANYVAGAQVYAARCAACHGADGQGQTGFPPLWGAGSYNAGAGMSKPVQMGTWVKQNMPLGNPNLTLQEVADVSLYVDAQQRPEFDIREHVPAKAIETGYYNAASVDDVETVKGNLKALGLDLDTIRGDKAAAH